jgi:hypothetical protein
MMKIRFLIAAAAMLLLGGWAGDAFFGPYIGGFGPYYGGHHFFGHGFGARHFRAGHAFAGFHGGGFHGGAVTGRRKEMTNDR